MTARTRVRRAILAFVAAAMLVVGASSMSPTTAAWVDQTAFRADATSLAAFPVLTSHDAIATSPGLVYSVLPTTQFDNDADLCVFGMSVTNTTSEPVEWWVEFDVRRPPLWGWDPTVPGAVGVNSIETKSFDATTGVWRIGGPSWQPVLQPGETVSNIGYCTSGSGPQVPDRPDLYEAVVTDYGAEWEICVTVRVATTFPWAIRWSTRVHMLDFYTAEQLEAHPVVTSVESVVTPVDGEPWTYDVVGAPGDTEFITSAWNLNGGPGVRVIDRVVCHIDPSAPQVP